MVGGGLEFQVMEVVFREEVNVIQLDQGTYRKIGKEKAKKQEHKRASKRAMDQKNPEPAESIDHL